MSESIYKIMKENKFEIVNEISRELICNICNELMIKACSAPCGCRFCSHCIEQYLDGDDKFCPGTSRRCQNKMINYANDIVIDIHANVKISEIIVKCPRQNCEFEDELEMIANHMRTCDKRPISCPFNEIGCKVNEVMNDTMKAHLNEDNYFHSKLLIDLINNLLSEMESMKNEIIEVKRENSQFKQQSINQQQNICEMERNEMENRGEIEQLCEEMVALKVDNRRLRSEMDTNAQSINEMRQQIRIIETKSQQQIEELKLNYQQQQQQLNNEMRQQLRMIEIKSQQQIGMTETKSKQQMDELKQNQQQQQQQLNNKVEMLRKEINKISKQNVNGASRVNNNDGVTLKHSMSGEMNDLELGIIDEGTILIDAEIGEGFGLKIENLLQREKNKRIYSKPFYSNGYKMCLSVIIYGNFGISVGFHLMRGDSDDKLKWPFKYAVSVDLIDSGNGNIWHSRKIKYSYTPDAAGWNKPVTYRNEGIQVYDRPNQILLNSEAIRNNQLLMTCKLV